MFVEAVLWWMRRFRCFVLGGEHVVVAMLEVVVFHKHGGIA
jgi:hypothetical protein